MQLFSTYICVIKESDLIAGANTKRNVVAPFGADPFVQYAAHQAVSGKPFHHQLLRYFHFGGKFLSRVVEPEKRLLLLAMPIRILYRRTPLPTPQNSPLQVKEDLWRRVEVHQLLRWKGAPLAGKA